ncbi:MAG: cation transporter dimerization domain-containing protein, partial [Persephonella sp.]|nr:cation transporter dimerization domain-containing protein [Persephonella sp.]
EEMEKIKKIIYSHPAVVDIKHIRGRVAGSFKFLDVEILLHNFSLRETHRIVDEIEKRIKEEIPNIDSVFIHYEPVRQKGLRIAFLVDEDKNIKDFRTASQILIVDISDEGKMQVNNPLEIQPDEKETGDILSKINVDIVVSANHPEEFEVRWKLARAGVMVWETEERNFEKALDEIVKSYREFNKNRGEMI